MSCLFSNNSQQFVFLFLLICCKVLSRYFHETLYSITSQILHLTTKNHLDIHNFVDNFKIYSCHVKKFTFTSTKFHLPFYYAATELHKILLQVFNLNLVFPFMAINKLSYSTSCTLFLYRL